VPVFTRFQYSDQSPYDYQDDGSSFNAPSYFRAADTHSIANGNQGYDDSLMETITNIPTFITASIVSGVNQIYNIAPSIGNALGGDFDISATADVMQALDGDLAKYYEEHHEGVDTLGFIASSLVPGFGGIKMLNAGQKALSTAIQSGRFGPNMRSGLKLLTPQRDSLVKKAVKEVINSDNPFRLRERNLVKAMGAGFGQNILEATAFETAVAVTMFDSPVLAQQDLGDLISNIAFGGVVFGAIGGVVDATRAAYKVKGALKTADAQAMPWKLINEISGGSPADDIVNYFEQHANMPVVPKDFGTDRVNYLTRQGEKTREELMVLSRKKFAELTGGDQELAEVMFQQAKLGGAKKVLDNYTGSVSNTRLADISTAEKVYQQAAHKVKKTPEKVTPEQEATYLNTSVTYTRHYGDDAGNITTEVPTALHLIDTLKAKETLKVTPWGVRAGAKDFKFRKSTKDKADSWSSKDATVMEADARRIWARAQPAFPEGQVVSLNDLPLMEKAYTEFSPTFKFIDDAGDEVTFINKQDMLATLTETKERLANELLERGTKETQEELASMLNVRNSYLSGEVSSDAARDILAMESYAEEYTKLLKGSKILKDDAPLVDLYHTPQHSKMVTDTTPVKDLDGNLLKGMAMIQQRAHEYMEGIYRANASVLGADYEKLIPLSMTDVVNANRLGAGAGLAAAASGNYGSLASKVEFIGNIVSGLKDKARSATSELLNAPLYKLSQSKEASIEWSVLNNRLRGIEDSYTFNAAGDALMPSNLKRYNELVAAGKKPKPWVPKTKDAPLEIPLVNAEVRELAKIHIETNAALRNKQRIIRNAQGVEHHVDADAFYPMPVNPRDFPYFATVTDSSLTGTGHTKTIYANTQKELDDMISNLDGQKGLEIRTKGEAEAYWKSIGQFDYDKTLHDNFLDSALKRKGVSQPYYVATDPQKIVNEMLSWHSDRASNLVMESVSAQYENIFSELKNLGKTYTNLATSKTGSLSNLKHADEVVENPYMDYVRTALGVRNYADYPFWTSANRSLEGKVSQMFKDVTKAAEGAKNPEDLIEVNRILDKYGYKGATYTEDMELLANHTAPKAVLTSFIQKSNALLATVMLRLDTLNAVNNTVGAQVLLGAETRSVIRAIERGDANAAGELAQLMKIKVPGQEAMMQSPQKLIANSIKRFGRDTPDMQFYRENRFISSISEQYRWVLDELTLTGRESVKDLGSKITAVQGKLKTAADTGERWTGNRLAEEFNRFIAADVMKQITDVAVKHGIMDNKTALSYINTFVNRTQGNYLASQRPMLFQGPVGQAIGLFQTYQFNLMQQLLRHVGEGKSKDYMTLLGLQGTIYGMNGMPAFNAINTHLIGTASGNQEHRDAYDTIYGTFGKEAGDWLMYGVASNMLLHPDAKINLYTRGDINPRHVTIVPTNPADIPIVGAYSKFLGNLFATAKQLAGGGDVSQTLLQGLEHNGLSRPLAGLAQTLQGMDNPNHSSYSTTHQGNVVASNDLVSLANLARMVGGKPLGEAVAVDAAFRMRAYGAVDTRRKSDLGEAIKSTLIAGNSPSPEQMDTFMESYVGLGGDQTEFNKWVTQLYKTSNTSQVNDLMSNLDRPYAKTLQKLMGGYELRDFQE